MPRRFFAKGVDQDIDVRQNHSPRFIFRMYSRSSIS
jgi:hypothetical protein